MKVLTVVGARPNFMKAAPIIAAIREHNRTSSPSIQHVLVHTGQHYDALMSDAFFTDLDLPRPDVLLGVGSSSPTKQIADISIRFEEVLLRERPDIVIVVGDVNSTVACALVTAKASFDATVRRPLLAHVEAGLRSFDRSMPEEVNRVVTDHISDLLFVTEDSGVRNLQNEGLSSRAIHFVGNTMIDSLLAFRNKADNSTILDRLGLRSNSGGNGAGTSPCRYALLTVHRPSNVDNRETFLNILQGLRELVSECPIVFPVHPRTRRQIREFGLERECDMMTAVCDAAAANNQQRILLTEPLGYLDFLCLMKHAALVVTDSGGVQEETTCLQVPCVTVRENTERPVTTETGTNVLAGTTKEKIRNAIRNQMTRVRQSNDVPRYWDGEAARRILEVLLAADFHRVSSGSAAILEPCR